MTVTFSNNTVQRLFNESKIAQKLNNLRLYKMVWCLLLIHEGRSFKDIAKILNVNIRTVYNWLKEFVVRRFSWLLGYHYKRRFNTP